jgi:hypothetical protein
MAVGSCYSRKQERKRFLRLTGLTPRGFGGLTAASPLRVEVSPPLAAMSIYAACGGRKTFTTGLRPGKTGQPPFRAMEMHPFCLRHLPRRGRFALHSAFVLISISRHNIAKTSPSGGSGALAPKGVNFHAPKARLYGFRCQRQRCRRKAATYSSPKGRYQNPRAKGPSNLRTLRTFGPLGPSTLTPARACLRALIHNKKSAKLLFSGFHGDPRGIRTPDTLIRSQVLYPAELLGQIGRGRGTQTPNLRFWRPLLYQLRYAPRRMFLATVLS